MPLTEMQKQLIIELKSQETEIDWILYILKRLTTQKQQQAMMEYLETTREKAEKLKKLIFKTIEIIKAIMEILLITNIMSQD